MTWLAAMSAMPSGRPPGGREEINPTSGSLRGSEAHVDQRGGANAQSESDIYHNVLKMFTPNDDA